MCVRSVVAIYQESPHVVIATNWRLLLSGSFLALFDSETQEKKKTIYYIVLGHHSLAYYPLYPRWQITSWLFIW